MSFDRQFGARERRLSEQIVEFLAEFGLLGFNLMFFVPGVEALDDQFVDRMKVAALDFLLNELFSFWFEFDDHSTNLTPSESRRNRCQGPCERNWVSQARHIAEPNLWSAEAVSTSRAVGEQRLSKSRRVEIGE